MKVFLYSFILYFFLFNCYTPKELPLNDCKLISNIPSPEDFTIDRETGWMYISSHNRREFESTGSIYSYHILTGKLQKSSLTFPEDFRPHGLHLAKIGKIKKLFVISHKKKALHSIEIFNVKEGEVIYETSLQDPALHSPNDLFVLEDGKIFVSNDFSSSNTLVQFWDIIWKRKTSPISYYDGKTWSLLEPKLTAGNGIYYKKENQKEYLYRASMLDNQIIKYEITWKDTLPLLKEIKVLELHSSPDNFEEDEKGNLIVAAHPSFYRFLRHSSSSKNISPTQIFRLFADDTWKEIYYNEGKEISAGSTSAIYKDRIFIGQVFEPFLLNCMWKEN